MKTRSFTDHCKFALATVVLSTSVLFTPLRAQEPASNQPAAPALTAGSSAADVEALATKIAKDIVSQPPGSRSLEQAVAPYLVQFAAVDHNILISECVKYDHPGQKDSKDSHDETAVTNALFNRSLAKYATPADIPHLLASSKWFGSLINERGFFADPAINPCLVTEIQGYQKVSPSDLNEHSVRIAFLDWALRNKDPKVQQVFSNFMNYVTTDPKIPLRVLTDIFYRLGSHEDDSAASKARGDVGLALLSRDDDAAGCKYLIGYINMKGHKVCSAKRKGDLAQSFKDYFAGNPKFPGSPYNLIVPAILGNPDALAKAIQLYYQSTDASIKSLIKTGLLDQITYSGNGNKLDDLRGHVQEVTWQTKGDFANWTLTMPGATPIPDAVTVPTH
jgi:hypothetical protein